jgi:hypothetical protein
MSKQVPSKEEQLLTERLRREAIESCPAFSESLHQHILATVRQHHAAVANLVTGTTASRRWPRVLVAALTAACLLCAVVIGWQVLANASRQNPVEKSPPDAPLIVKLPSIGDFTNHTIGKLDELSVSAALEPQTTPLKRDARAVASVFLNRLPIDMKMADDR